MLDMLLPSSMHEQLDNAIGVRVDGFALHEIIAHGKLGFPRKNEWQPNHADYGVDQRGQGHVGDEAALDQCRARSPRQTHVRQMLRARIGGSWRAFHVPATVSECGLWESDGPEERQYYVSWPLIFSR
ncbi:hypothetical protein [Novosphingobium mathurense]|uniref:hypothetical protein n=1 Tax=Novosphingobium mathurense TaxID=428990 RepID=UPI0015905C9F|nr:hypothetical protein [Novosphingobium mathurense]